MSSRPNNSRRRAANEIAVEGTSRNNIPLPSTSRSTEAFFYPPLAPMTPTANRGVSQPLVPPTTKSLPPLPPHPYQSYAPGSYDYRTSSTAIPAGSSTHLQPGTYVSALSPSASSVNVDPTKPRHAAVQQTYYVHHHHHHHHHHSAPPQNPLPPPARRAQVGRPLSQQITGSRLLRKYRHIILVLLFLPIPPLLSVLYVIVGHSILRRASSSPTDTETHNPWSPSLLSSANAAATGGTILSLPLFLTLYIILPSPRHTPTRSRTPRDDFFEDDDDEADGVLARVMDAAAYVACAVLLICVGAAAAALGVTCLEGGSAALGQGERQREKMLSPGRAAEAGIVGAAVLLGAVLVLVATGVVGWWLWVNRRRREGEEEGKE